MGCGWVAQAMWWVAQAMWWEGCAGYVVGGLMKIMPRCGSILQAGTCQIFSLAENQRWSRVWQYIEIKIWTNISIILQKLALRMFLEHPLTLAGIWVNSYFPFSIMNENWNKTWKHQSQGLISFLYSKYSQQWELLILFKLRQKSLYNSECQSAGISNCENIYTAHHYLQVKLGTIKKLRNPFLDSLDLPPVMLCNLLVNCPLP